MKKGTWVGVVMIAATQIACSGVETTEKEGGGIESDTTRTEVAPRVKTDWVGHRVGASPGHWYDKGELRLAAKGSRAPEVTTDSSLHGPPEPARPTVSYGDPKSGRVYEIDMDRADIARVASYLEEKGYANGTPGDSSELNEVVDKSWSTGTDSRVPKGIHELGVIAEPLQKIGQMDAHCTATLVGTPETAYYIITAAHCFWEELTGDYLDPDFAPRRDNCTRPDGTTIAGCDTTPWGDWDGLGWLMPTYFVDNCRGLANQPIECTANDIAIQEVSGAGEPGAMGFGAWNSTDLATFNKQNRGYPNCNGTGDPVTNCRPRTLYGDSSSCSVGSYTMPDGDGWNRLIRHGCDTSPGMSGSPLYLYSDGAKVFGVHSGGDSCYTPACTTARPNYLRRVTAQWYADMLNFMGI
jgi:hypothetical protein